MTDRPPPAEESAIARALRLKKAALAAKPKPPGGGKFSPERNAGVTAGASKPWLKR